VSSHPHAPAQIRARISPNRSSQHQRGIVMIVALVVLIALTIASVGLLRSVDTAGTVASNLGVKKDLYRVSNLGVQRALLNLSTIRVGNELPGSDNTGLSYYSTASNPTLAPDARGIPQNLVNAPMPASPGVGTGWSGEFALPVAVDSGAGVTTSGGYLFRYVAERLCPTNGPSDPALNPCRQATGVGTASPSGSFQPLITQGGTVYIRLTLRVDGPKNSTSYFQAMLL
jgi:type IV pilus assembly protein PilX